MCISSEAVCRVSRPERRRTPLQDVLHSNGSPMFPKSRVGANAANRRLYEAAPVILVAFHDRAGLALTKDIARA